LQISLESETEKKTITQCDGNTGSSESYCNIMNTVFFYFESNKLKINLRTF